MIAGPRTPYPRPSVSDKSNHVSIQQSVERAAGQTQRKGSVVFLRDGFVAYMKPPSTITTSTDTVLTLMVKCKGAASGKRVATIRIPADADQATARKWSTAGLPPSAIAVESTVSTTVAASPGAPSIVSDKSSASNRTGAKPSLAPRLNFDDVRFLVALRKKYKLLLGSNIPSRIWRHYLSARCLKRIVVVPPEGPRSSFELPTTLSANISGSSSFPGRLSNVFQNNPGSPSTAPALPAATDGESEAKRKRARPPNIRADSLGPHATAKIAAGAPRSPRFLARKGLSDTFSEDRMLAHFGKPGKGKERFAWVYWAHRIAQNIDEEYQYDEETGIVSSPTHGAEAMSAGDAVPGGLEFVESWCAWRIAGFASSILVGSLLAAILYITMGPMSPLQRKVLAIGIGDGLGAEGLGSHNAESRVVAGDVIGMLCCFLGSGAMGVLVVLSYLTM